MYTHFRDLFRIAYFYLHHSLFKCILMITLEIRIISTMILKCIEEYFNK